MHLECLLVEGRGELIKGDSFQRLLMLSFDPLSLFLFDQLLGLEDGCSHIFLTPQRCIFQLHVLLLQSAY